MRGGERVHLRGDAEQALAQVRAERHHQHRLGHRVESLDRDLDAQPVAHADRVRRRATAGPQLEPLEDLLVAAAGPVGRREVEHADRRAPLAVGERAEVPGDRLLGGAVEDQPAVGEEQRARAQVLERHQVVAHVEDRAALVGRDRLHLLKALGLETGVADRQDLVDDEDLGVEVRGHREREAHPHAARVPLDRRLEELVHLGEVHDLLEPAVDRGARHPEDRAVHVHVLEPGQLGVEPGADFEQGPDVARHLDPPRGGRRDAAEDLQQRALARAVLADDPHGLALGDVEAQVVERGESLPLHAPADRVGAPGAR